MGGAQAGGFLATKTVQFASDERTKNAAKAAIKGAGNMAKAGLGLAIVGVDKSIKGIGKLIKGKR